MGWFGKKRYRPPDDLDEVIAMVREVNRLYDLAEQGDVLARKKAKPMLREWHQQSARGVRRARRLVDRIEALGPEKAQSRIEELMNIVKKHPQNLGASIDWMR